MSRQRNLTPGDDREKERSHSCLFVLRLWKANTPAGPEYRGSVRDVTGGAWRHFRDLSTAHAFLVQQVDEHERERQLGKGEPMQ